MSPQLKRGLWSWRVGAVAVIALISALSTAQAQQAPLRAPAQSLDVDIGASDPVPGDASGSRAVAPVAEKPSVPALPELVMLARSTLVAVSQANEVNDYSVLYALSGPQLRASGTKEQLAEALSGLRVRDIDLSPVTVIVPTFSPRPFVDETGILRLVGVFPTEPLQVRFALSYRLVMGIWRLEGLAIDASPAPADAAPQASARPPERARPTVQSQQAPAQGPAAQQRPRRPASSSAELDRRTDPPTTTRY